MLKEIVPIIQPSDWPNASNVICRPFFEGDDSPLIVAYGVVTPAQNYYVTKEILAELGIPAEDLEQHALTNWLESHTDIDWQPIVVEDESSPVMAVRGGSELISTLLLSHGHLKGLHKHFGSEILSLIIPDRFSIAVHSDPGLFMPGLAESLYDEAVSESIRKNYIPSISLSPYCFSSREGRVVAYIDRESDHSKNESKEYGTSPLDIGGFVLCVSFVIVAAADGTIDDKEINTFADMIERCAEEDTGICGQICTPLSERETTPLHELLRGELSPPILFAKLVGSLKAFSEAATPNDTIALKNFVRQITQIVASSSGRSIFGFGSKISRNEQMALNFIETCLQN